MNDLTGKHVVVLGLGASGIARPATIRSAAVPSRALRDASQPTAMKAAYIATTARTLRLGIRN